MALAPSLRNSSGGRGAESICKALIVSAPSTHIHYDYRLSSKLDILSGGSRGLFTLSDSVTVTVTLMGKMVCNPFCPSQFPSKTSKVPSINTTVTVMESLGVNGPLGTLRISAPSVQFLL